MCIYEPRHVIKNVVSLQAFGSVWFLFSCPGIVLANDGQLVSPIQGAACRGTSYRRLGAYFGGAFLQGYTSLGTLFQMLRDPGRGVATHYELVHVRRS